MIEDNNNTSELMLFGIPASPGIAHGPVFRFLHDEVKIATYEVEESDQAEEIKRFLEALEMTKSEIRKQYKKLVKDLHPDMNGGERADEDRLQEVVWAWDQIKDSRSFKD